MPAKEKKSKSKASELRVVFDSSVIYIGSEADLVRGEAADLIRENTQHLDLSVIWYLPSVVRHERQSQMQKRALDLLPSIQKLERLLGHQLNITEPIIKQRVNEAVETQIVSLGLKILELDQTKVDLNRLIHDACYRVPPFTDREKEKGFRDACIVETFAQLVEASPKTSRACRVVIVTGDALLADAIRMRTSDANNVRILNSIEELKGLINTLVEQVREEFVKTYRTKAQEYFFEADREEGLFYKEKIRSRIGEKFKEHLESIPKGSDERKNGMWHIGTPSSSLGKSANGCFGQHELELTLRHTSGLYNPHTIVDKSPSRVDKSPSKVDHFQQVACPLAHRLKATPFPIASRL